MKHYVRYVYACQPELKSFKTKKSMDEFLLKFLLENQGEEDNWVDIIFTGEVNYLDGFYKDYEKDRA